MVGRGSGAMSPAVATCDTGSVRSVDTTLASITSDQGERERREEDEPQDLSISIRKRDATMIFEDFVGELFKEFIIVREHRNLY